MDELNSATLEASQRLVKAGIVLETEAVWYLSQTLGQKKPFAELMSRYRAKDFMNSVKFTETANKIIPAPSMTEAWRELPDSTQIILVKRGVNHIVSYAPNANFMNTNPTDALIDLLIWVRGER
jgi:hypothetical protein